MNILNKENDIVLSYFYEIAKIPRETGKEKQISDYLVNFAKERNLEVYQDELYNIIIRKKSTILNYKGPTVILQGHMDMVYDKDSDSKNIYENGIEIIEKDGYIYGNKTTLGADNGIALAYFLTLLDKNDIKHPDLEIIITVQEEAGLVGAQFLDVSSIKGKYMINMDAEEEGVFFTSCAGGMRSYVHIPIIKEKIDGYIPLAINIHDLKGGHSGLEIDKERGNAIKLLGRLLYEIDNEDIYIQSIKAPGKANAIASNSQVHIMIKEDQKENIITQIQNLENIFKKELEFIDSISIGISDDDDAKNNNVYSQKSKNLIINTLMLMPNGVVNKSFAIPGLVQTSTNIGSIEESEDRISVLSSSRSSIRSQKYNIKAYINTITNVLGIESEFFNDYPEWEYNSDSRLQRLVGELYEEVFDEKPVMTAIHAGLECGYFADKLEYVDIISFGPNLYEVHTTTEHASIESIKNVWIFLIHLLEKIASEDNM